MKKTFVKRAALSALVLASVLMSGCGASGKHALSENMVQETVAYDSYSQTPDMAAAATAAAADAGLTGEEYSISKSPDVSQDRKLIRDVSMDVETDDFDTLITLVNRNITDLGGYAEQSRTSGRRVNYRNEPQPRNASIIARIPSDKLDRFVIAVEENGNVIDKSETTQDVTLKYSDLESRKKSLSIEQERIWALLEKADTLEAVISLEQRLSEIRYELESMESQLRLFDNQVEYSTVTVFIQEVTNYTPTAPETATDRMRNGFSDTLEGISDFLVSLCIGAVSLSPIWVPLVVIAVVAVLLIRRRRKKPNVPEEQTDDKK